MNHSGIKEGIWEFRRRLKDGNFISTIWIIEEILNSKDLADEGKAMKHCVYSYDERIASGKVSIWSLQKDSERKLTVEVENSSRTIVQAREKYNRLPDKKEMKILNKWASKKKLIVKIPTW
ncbi:hypothetical protein ES703_42149 [subsurface metagenome]